MKQEYQLLHRHMIHDIVRCMQLELSEEERVESCFWIANNYWEKLKEMVKSKKFNNDTDEVDFFRNVKPQFTCHIEYYSILYEALQFAPGDEKAALCFWEEEYKRFSRFCSRNETFVSYYENGDKYGDSIYFLRENKQPGSVVTTIPYDADAELCASHDRVLRSYLAHKKYNEYVKMRLEQTSTLNQASNN